MNSYYTVSSKSYIITGYNRFSLILASAVVNLSFAYFCTRNLRNPQKPCNIKGLYEFSA